MSGENTKLTINSPTQIINTIRNNVCPHKTVDEEWGRHNKVESTFAIREITDFFKKFSHEVLMSALLLRKWTLEG